MYVTAELTEINIAIL